MLQGENKPVCTKDMLFTDVVPFYQWEPVKRPFVTARVLLLKFNRVLFELTFQSVPPAHIVLKVVSVYKRMLVLVSGCVRRPVFVQEHRSLNVTTCLTDVFHFLKAGCSFYYSLKELHFKLLSGHEYFSQRS